MLTYVQRVDRYLAQTGRIWNGDWPPLTARQRRRAAHKVGHQMVEAAGRRADRSTARAAVRAARKTR